MKKLFLIKLLLALIVLYNAWLLLTVKAFNNRFTQGIQLINYQSDLFTPTVGWIFSYLSLATGWTFFIVTAMQCSVIVTLLSTNITPYFTTLLGLCGEGLIYLALGRMGRMEKGIGNPGWVLVCAGLSQLLIRQRELSILNIKKQKVNP